ncbi:FAD-dependent oxidoreductase [Enterococcus sp.]|jgi:NADPH-dependent 2,4-dienoyl-CoA reductase/sulfur reductase-like enzyme|uniref:FAD-dependent oxidoreductase n=1 Tax=Enterococcus sp. TaxID=35783 RepID=UPI0025BE057B|nr:FAD-dependent oxidoreductase [Enterococcus sp.]
MRIVIIGGSHAGIAAARHLKQMDRKIEVIIIEKSNVLGYIASSLNLVLEGYIEHLEDSRTVTASELLSEGINVMLNSRVVAITAAEKTISFETSTASCIEKDTIAYDSLILAMGSSNFRNAFTEEVKEYITTYKTIGQSREALHKVQEAQKVAIVGAGLIGFELAESLSGQEKEVFLIDRMDTLLFRYFDQEISQILIKRFPENLQIYLNSSVVAAKQGAAGELEGIELANGTFLPADIVVYAVNPRPNVDLVADFLKLNPDGTIDTNEFLQTSDPNIYAIGDLVSIPFNHSDSALYVPLVTNAYRTGIVAATNILSANKIPFPKMQRTVVSKLFGYYVSSSGINETEAPYYGFDVDSVTRTFHSRSFFETETDFEVTLKLVFDRHSRVIMGGQIITSDRGSLEIINTVSTLITAYMTLDQLATMDYFFNPTISFPLHFLNQLAIEGLLKTHKS